MMEGRIQKTTFQGDATVESLDPDTVTKLLHYLDLTSPVSIISVVYPKVSVILLLTEPTVSGSSLHHAGYEEEPSGHGAFPLSSSSSGHF